jgi:hypothetical protein
MQFRFHPSRTCKPSTGNMTTLMNRLHGEPTKSTKGDDKNALLKTLHH